MNENSRISLSLTASDVSRFNDWLDDKCAACRLDKTLAADIKLCLNEVLANLMSYGLKQTSEPLTVVDLTLQPDSARAAVTDNGAYFDMRGWETPGDRDLLNGEPGGFGISLIKERASRVFYTRIGDLNHLIIVCERSGLHR
jgi:anti-sigma regulatory factor (Ser/Thr protein kinase)